MDEVIPQPHDLLTVAKIDTLPETGSTLYLMAHDLGNLVDIVGEEARVYRVAIIAMRRDEFEDLDEFEGFGW